MRVVNDEEDVEAVPNLSLTLDSLWTETRVRFDPDARADHFVVDGQPLDDQGSARAKGQSSFANNPLRLTTRQTWSATHLA